MIQIFQFQYSGVLFQCCFHLNHPRASLKIITEHTEHYVKCKEFIFYSSDGIVIRLWDGQLRGHHAIPDRGRNFVLLQNVHTSNGAHPAPYTMNTESCLWLTTCPNLVPRQRMSGAVPPLFHIVSSAQTWTILPLADKLITMAYTGSRCFLGVYLLFHQFSASNNKCTTPDQKLIHRNTWMINVKTNFACSKPSHTYLK